MLSKRDLGSLASGVHKRYTVLMRDMTPWLDVMPDPWKARLVYLKECVDRELAQVGPWAGGVVRGWGGGGFVALRGEFVWSPAMLCGR